MADLQSSLDLLLHGPYPVGLAYIAAKAIRRSSNCRWRNGIGRHGSELVRLAEAAYSDLCEGNISSVGAMLHEA